ncbi:unnamed protein product [Nezara viridula]|uniref:Suppressor of forked domain-containing protein n=1 Tax=Nezara viridula TaxID=85310 RepID=A0A9P0HM29_NEZVI|nr:unnamed protein product [Nezara viridula]
MGDENVQIEWGSEKLVKAQQTIDENKWDIEAWGVLIREAQGRWINDVRPFFERLVATFPTTGRYWKIYIEQEMKGRNFERVEKLFQRCLIKVLNIKLWKLYLAYVKETKAALPTFKEKMAQAYDFALEKIGMDIQSYSIWNDYVTFLKGVEAVGSYAENQKITAVRKVYQRGVVNPMLKIENLWKDYMAYEQGINPIIAEKMAMERSRDYMNARRVAKEFEAITRGLSRSIPSVPPTGSLEELKQVELWKKYIAWEKSNPLRSEDTALVTRRVMFAFEQCLLCLGHHADIWYEAAQFLDYSSKVLTEKGDVTSAKLFNDEAGNMFERATSTVLRNNMLLHFAYADFEEGRLKYDKVHQIYQKFLELPDIDPTLTYVQYMKFARRAEGIKSARNVFKKAREDNRSKYQAKDNNTRVLFERVLTSGSLEPEKSVEIWNRFLEFECNIGDLASIVKVEKRRSAVLGKIRSQYRALSRKRNNINLDTQPQHPLLPQSIIPRLLECFNDELYEQIAEFEGKETAQLVDRYRFLDLYPCTIPELKSIGYNEVTTRTTNLKSSIHSSVPGFLADGLLDDEGTQRLIPRPDVSQMIPFKPKLSAYPGEHPVPGGAFPMPPAVGHLCSLLPPPQCFHGPFVAVDRLIDIFSKIQLPDTPPVPQGDNGCDTRLFDLAKSVHWIVDNDEGGTVKRRKLGDDSDDEENMAPPINDIYRLRQQKRVK